jgi:hypothetical protein
MVDFEQWSPNSVAIGRTSIREPLLPLFSGNGRKGFFIVCISILYLENNGNNGSLVDFSFSAKVFKKLLLRFSIMVGNGKMVPPYLQSSGLKLTFFERGS